MKGFVTVVALLASLCFSPIHAAGTSTDREFNVYVNPLGLLLGSANAAFEYKLDPRITLGLAASYSKVSSGTASATGWGVGVRPVFFLTNDAYDIDDSWFVSPFVDYAHASNDSASISGVALGANIGYWWYFENGINLNLGFGAQYISLDFTQIGLLSVSAILPSAAFSVGYAF